MNEREEALREIREELKQVPRKMRGLGDLVHKVTDFLGFHHCSECEKRRQRMNRWMRFSKEG
jgi:hypothetical protein